MANAFGKLGLRVGYGARQLPRVAWYVAHGYAMGRLRRLMERSAPTSGPSPGPAGTTPGAMRLRRDLLALFLRDLENVEAGIYPMPRDAEADLPDLLSRSGFFLADLPRTWHRRQSKAAREVATDDRLGRYPDYYLQNFHYQSDGYLSDDSARLYDIQVEVLFNGAANAMRRRALVPIAAHVHGRDQRTLSMVDVACGTGRFLRAVKEAFPRLPALGIDLSAPYLDEAAGHLAERAAVRLAVANAEAIPLPDGSQDIVTSIYLFHELPPDVRRAVAAEFARILKPGGLLVFVDSLQRGDVDDYDGLLELFPVGYHEPYYDSYTREDLPDLFGEAGLAHLSDDVAFVSKVSAFRRL